SQNCPCEERRFLIRHQQPEHQAHSRRSPISTESHHEIGLQTGQHNDARMNLAIALTAARYGAAIANYTEVVHLLKRADPQTGKERVYGAHCRDVITGQEFDVRAKCVINATGPFTDALRKMDDQKNPDICQPSAGVHIVILGYYR
ncbi:Glycerol-3-phosphate dehydrogenase, mitochondrial, partial [Larimichthys crocea]